MDRPCSPGEGNDTPGSEWGPHGQSVQPFHMANPAPLWLCRLLSVVTSSVTIQLLCYIEPAL